VAGAHHDRLDATIIEGARQNYRRRPFADGANGAEDRDAWTGDVMDLAAERAPIFLVTRPADIDNADLVGDASRREHRIVVEEFVHPADDVEAVAHGLDQQTALMGGQHAG